MNKPTFSIVISDMPDGRIRISCFSEKKVLIGCTVYANTMEDVIEFIRALRCSRIAV